MAATMAALAGSVSLQFALHMQEGEFKLLEVSEAVLKEIMASEFDADKGIGKGLSVHARQQQHGTDMAAAVGNCYRAVEAHLRFSLFVPRFCAGLNSAAPPAMGPPCARRARHILCAWWNLPTHSCSSAPRLQTSSCRWRRNESTTPWLWQL
jgi:hypothetical protein